MLQNYNVINSLLNMQNIIAFTRKIERYLLAINKKNSFTSIATENETKCSLVFKILKYFTPSSVVYLLMRVFYCKLCVNMSQLLQGMS